MIKLCLDISKEEANYMWDDVLRFLTIAVVIHLLIFSVDNQGNLFDEDSLKKFLYLTIGVVIYHLIIKKLIKNKEICTKKKKKTKNIKKKIKNKNKN